MGRSPCSDENGIKKGPWTPEEDELLVDYIKANGHGSWRAFPKLAGLNRCGKSCRLRWNNYLRPDIKRGKFTEEEDELIIRLHSVLGNKWSQIATHLSGRTDNEIKNHWNTHLRKKLLQLGIDPITHAQRTDFNFLANLPQLFAMENVASSLNPWDNALRVQANAATQLAKLQVLHNLLQVINGFSPTPNLDFIHLPRSNQIPDNSFLNQYVRSNSQFDPGNITLVPGQNPNHVPNSKFYCPNSSNCEFHSISNTGFDDQIPSLSFMNDTTAATTKNNINSPHTFANANTIPNLVSASPENSGANQTENDEISPTDTSKNLSTSTTTFEPWGDFNIDDDANDHYWKYFIE